MKPFKPLSFVGRKTSASQQPVQSHEPPAKRRRISHEASDDDHQRMTTARANVPKQQFQVPQKSEAPARKPLAVVQNPSSSLPPSSKGASCPEGYFNVLWRKPTAKKNKIWDGDGLLAVRGGFVILHDTSGKELGRTASKGPLLVGSGLSVSGKEVEIESVISKDDFYAGRMFLGNVKQQPRETQDQMAGDLKRRVILPLPASQANNAAFKAPLLNNTVQLPKKDSKVPIPRHDPHRPNALVMKRPTSASKGRQIVDVVVDPLLTDRLREHQRVSVSFLYECVMGMKNYDREGAILADDMGLGKTLQTIALLWTLLKQNPIHEALPVISKALIVCPVSLINNWRKEFRRWLGAERIGVFVLKDKKTRLTDFTMGKAYSVMIVGYEKLRMIQDDLQKGTGIDIVIADEGHRMKTAQNKSAQAIKSLNTERRIILSGTPLQNDLAEFYTMVDFINPGLLNKYSVFKREFENPILKSRQSGVSEKDKEKGEARSEELAKLTAMFILRRDASILSKYLPPKTEYVLFCKPTEAQSTIYRAIVDSPTYGAALGSPALSLELINVLKKVCNSPKLLLKKNDKGEVVTKAELLDCIPQGLLKSPGASGKLQVLDSLLHQIRTTTDEKVVLVSNYTSTLDVLASLLDSLSYKYLRLDGTTPTNKRQELVDRFNRSPPSNSFVFLLSAKAGGVGINLHGASRLILFDLDWNPATDLQAMARVHRDGQKKPCYIYRLLTKGALDEKIFQRQVSKTGLADSIVDGKNTVSSFTREELRDLFRLDESDGCQTHNLLGCFCGGKGMPMVESENHDNDENEEPERSDPADLGSSTTDDKLLRDERGVEIVHLDGDDPPSSSYRGGWKSAKEYNKTGNAMDSTQSADRAKMLSLMRYTHFDVAGIDDLSVTMDLQNYDAEEDEEDEGATSDPLESVIEDAALRSVLRERGRRVGFVFSKLGGQQST